MRKNYKRNKVRNKENYRAISGISHLLTLVERLVYKQLEDFMRDKFSSLLAGFRKNHSTQHCLVNLRNGKNIYNGKIIVSIFMDFSKALDTINHDLVVVKLKGTDYLIRL